MVVMNDVINNASNRYEMNNVMKAEAANKNMNEPNTEVMSEVAASVTFTKKMDNGMSAQAGVIDAAQESITKNQVADMSLAEVNKKLYRITQLSIQASHEGKSYSDKKELQDEIHKLRLEIQNAGKKTNFNGKNVFESMGKPVYERRITGDDILVEDNRLGDATYEKSLIKEGTYEMGANNAPKINIDYNAIVNELEAIDVTKKDGTKEALEHTNKAMDYVDSARSYIRAEQNRLIQLIQEKIQF